MKKEITKMASVVRALNQKKSVWSYLTSISYMLNSKVYVNSLWDDAKKVKKHINNKSRILDFGTGSGVFAVLLRHQNQKCKLFAIDTRKDKSQPDPNFKDTEKQQAELWKELSKLYNIDFAHYDAKTIPFPDKHFDAITAYAVIEHINVDEWDKIISELKRVLKPKGKIFIFKAPRKMAIMEHIAKIIGLGHHQSLFSSREIKNAFEKHGFETVKNWKSDMVFEFPGKITNPLFIPLKFINFIFYYSPFRIFAHHNNFVFRKCAC